MRTNLRTNYSFFFTLVFISQTGINTLIGSLVRLPDNYLHMAESERVLRNEEKFQELIDLYRSKKEHKKGGGEGRGREGGRE